MKPARFWSLRWILTTLLVIAGVGVLIRLGIWQLDRLAQRRAFNERVSAQITASELDLNHYTDLNAKLFDMEYRNAVVHGQYDFTQEVLLRNQALDGKLGFHVLTPLRIANSDQTVLVDRGWIPFDQASPEKRQQYQEPGEVTVQGAIRRPQTKPDFGGVADPTLAPGETRVDAWNIVNLERIQQQIDLSLLPVYIVQAPDTAWTGLPVRQLVMPEITEGPHLGYAMQWFTFAAILGLGYPFFVCKQLRLAGKTVKNLEIERESA
ncbi:MAG TPA: SURF1 family protein [Longilinea sp.]|nr:SURF1 family protein [Longilinea sp.]